jgi:hypothetical protein
MSSKPAKTSTDPTDPVEQNPAIEPGESGEAVIKATVPPEGMEELDEDERELRALRRDVDGVKGASAAGTVSINVGKTPPKNEFFRTDPNFRVTLAMVVHEVGIEKQFIAVHPDMIPLLEAIGISVADHTLYLTVTSEGAITVIPVRQAASDREQNEYDRTKEIGLNRAVKEWKRLYTDMKNRVYKVFPEPGSKDAEKIKDRFGDPVFPSMSEAKIIRLGFKDKGRMIADTQHTLYLKWVARDAENNK